MPPRVALVLLLAACGGARRAEPPATLGQGFVDLTEGLAAPFPVAPADPVHDAEPTAGFFGDLDGDGATDVVLTPTRIDPEIPRAPVAYHFVDGRLEAMAALPTDDLPLLGAPDLDGDGVTDLLTAMRFREVAWGLGGGAFEPPGQLDPGAPATSFDGVPAAALVDLDSDGWIDILAGDGTCLPGARELRPLLRVAQRVWRDRVDLVAPANQGQPYAVLAAELPSGDSVIASIGRSCQDDAPTPVFYRRAGLDAGGYPVWEPFDPQPQDVGYERHGSTLAGNSPMAGGVADLDGDGVLDLIVTLNPRVAVYAGRSGAGFVDRTNCTGIDSRNDEGNRMIPWGVAPIDFDRDGRRDLLLVHGNDYDAAFNTSHYVGEQWTTLEWNAGDWAFADATEVAGLGMPGQWKALAVGDLDGDGAADAIAGGQALTPRVYLNRIDTGNHGLALRLHGTTSNHLGVGARVVVTAAGRPPQIHVAGALGEPHALSEPLVFVGLGAATAADEVTITWPSGREQRVTNLEAGRVHDVTEPPILTLDPPGRHVPADGVSAAWLLVPPDVADPELAVVAGPGVVEGPITVDDSGSRYRLVAPDTPGSSVIEIRVAGRASPVRPRVWWDNIAP